MQRRYTTGVKWSSRPFGPASKTIGQDIRLLFTMARWLESNTVDGRRMRLTEVVSDYQNTILDELNLQQEGANASMLRRNFDRSPLLYVPEGILVTHQ